MASCRREQARQKGQGRHIALTGDVTQAFVHAPIDELIVTVVPRELDGLMVQINGEAQQLRAGDCWLIVMALYGYRKSPQLWQHFLIEAVTRLGVYPCRTEPAIFMSRRGTAIMVVHVDDLLVFGEREDILQLF